MPEDPYITYLKLPPGPRPPKAHVLLGVEPDVNDPAIIEAAAQRKMDELDQYALSSDKATRDQVQKLMGEVARARVKLVKRAEAKVKKTPPVVPPVAPVAAQEAPAAPVTAPKPAKAEPNPTPTAAKETRPKTPWFAWPSLSAEAWSLLGVAWLMSLAATAVGAYFIAANQPVTDPAQLAGNNPLTVPNNPEPTDDPATPPNEQADPQANPDQQTPPETGPENEPETNPQPEPQPQPQTPEAIAAATMDTVMQINDRDDRLKAYLLAREALAVHSRDQKALIIEATRRFNGSDDLNIDLQWHGNRYRVSAAIHDGIKDHPNLQLTDLSSFTGLSIASLNLQNCRGIKDLSTLGKMDLTTLEIAGCVGIKDLTQLNRFQSIETLIVGGSSLTSLDGLSLRNLKSLRIVESPITDLAPLSKMELEELYLQNCYRLTSLEAMESMPPLQVFRLIDEPDRRLSGEYTRVESIRPSVTARYMTAPTSSVWPRAEGPSLPEPEVVATHIAEHNKLDKIPHAPDRHKAFIKLRDAYKPFSQEQVELIEREIKHLNNLDRLQFAMEDDPVEPRVMVGLVDKIAGSQNHLVTDLSPLAGLNTYTLAVQHLPNLRDFTFLQGAAVDTLMLTGCSQFNDVSILREVDGLASLDIGQTAVTDLRQLRLKSLKRLTLDGCKGLTDLNGLHAMQLEVLSAAGCSAIREVSALARVSGLTHVNLEGTAIQSASALSRQSDLKHLSLSGCKKLATLSGLHLLRGLKELHL